MRKRAKITKIFFRNDDVFQLSNEFIEVTNLFIKERIPICHGIVPARINQEAVFWLKGVKKRYPDLVEIDQHGFRHKRRDEFGNSRSYQQQFEDIRRGKEIMLKYFGKDFSGIFTLPWQTANEDTIKALADLGYKAFSGNYSVGLLPKIFYSVGRLLKKANLFGYRISYQGKGGVLDYKIKEISVSIDLVKDYEKKKIKGVDEFIKEFSDIRKQTRSLGIMIHHRVFNTATKFNTLVAILEFLKKQSCINFEKMEELI